MKAPLSPARAAALGAAALLTIHLATLVSALAGGAPLSAPARAALVGLRLHLAAFNAALAAAVLLTGALCGAATWLSLRAFGALPTAPRAIAGTLLLAGLQAARTLARKPALFEDLLWRKGGARAALQVLVVERVGAHALDISCLVLLAAVGAAALLRIRPRILALLPLAAALLVLALALAPAWRRHPPHPSAPPIVILAADSLRPDHFSSEGYARPTTPRLDALRKQGTWVADEFVPIASTTASWASLMTGVYPHRHGVRDLFPRDEQTHLHLPLLPRLLAARGYATAVVSDYAGESFSRVELGFDTVDAPPATSVELFADRETFQRLPLALAFFTGAVGARLFPVAGYLPDNADPAALTERALARLDALEETGKPFLLVVFYSTTHTPFAAPMPDARAFSSPGYAGPSRYAYELQQLEDLGRFGQAHPLEEVEQLRALYDGALRAFDREVGRLLDRLDRDGLRDRIVVVTGDHGESLFEPGATTEHGKWFAGGEAANRTALLLQGAGVPVGTVEGVASGVDLMPTLLDLAHAPIPSGLDGVSLLRGVPSDRAVFAETTLWLGGAVDTPPGALVSPDVTQLLEVSPRSHALVLKQRYQERAVTAKLRAARRGPWELVYMPTEREPVYTLFDLELDPFAQRDLFTARPEVAGPLRAELLRFLAADRLRWLDPQDRLVPRVEQ